ncbi:transmembrane protein 45B-like [Mytilus californianus]|uniref:transmembrane protein 45B-like n=1 Tax=Mytilus californianus TaxID=6549 RepID=UPI0022467457|nr:transmembrane protein 45B-like [Mytilus californianus]
MGTFSGHAIPGSFFIVFAIWWTICQYDRYYTCLKRNAQFTSTLTYPLSCGKFKIQLFEPIMKITLATIGICGEIYTGFDEDNEHFIYPGNAQHATMFCVFGIGAVLDILIHYKCIIPKDIDYTVFILSVGIEGLLFHFHLHGRNALDTRIHTLLIYAIVFSVIAVILEMKYRNNILAALTKSYFFFVQGMWFWQIGFILYNPYSDAQPLNPEDDFQLMMVPLYFTWHCVIVLFIMLGIGFFVACYHRHLYHKNEVDKSSLQSLL